jgi:hypothetical protein
MRTVSEPEAIRLFARLMTPFIEVPPSTSRELFEVFVGFHREIRVRGADDSLMLEWGVLTPHRLDGFTDLRVCDFEWDKKVYQWLGLSRQLKSTQDDGDTALRAFVYFGDAVGGEPSSNMEFDGLEGLERALGRFVRQPYVAALLAARPSQVTAFVGEIG